jgi:hypothetical protein
MLSLGMDVLSRGTVESAAWRSVPASGSPLRVCLCGPDPVRRLYRLITPAFAGTNTGAARSFQIARRCVVLGWQRIFMVATL